MSSGSNLGEIDDAGLSVPSRWKAVRFERPVVLLGCDLGWQEVTASACTIVVGAKGCIVRSSVAFPFEGRISLCCNNKVIEGDLRVSEPLERNEAHDSHGALQYLISFDHSDSQFWEKSLEPADVRERYELECSACHFSMSAELTDEDEMVYLADSAVIQRCPCCKAATRFMAAQPRIELLDVAQDPNLVVSGHHIYHMQPARKEVNERQFRRMPIKGKAYLRIPDRDDDVVNLLDVSRGGLRFESMQNYEQGLEFEVATHYVEGGNNIFQKARIVRKHRRPSVYLPGEYGVMFLNNIKAG